MDEGLLLLFSILGVLGVVMSILVVVLKGHQALVERKITAWKSAAKQLDLQYGSGGSVDDAPFQPMIQLLMGEQESIEHELRGTPYGESVVLREFYNPAASFSKRYTRGYVNLGFVLPPDFSVSAGSLFATSNLQTGDADFDTSFSTCSNTPEQASLFLQPRVRRALIELARHTRNIKLEKDKLHFASSRGLRNARIHSTAKAALQCAQALQHMRGNHIPPPATSSQNSSSKALRQQLAQELGPSHPDKVSAPQEEPVAVATHHNSPSKR